jgi:hypothetical protein
LRICPGPVINFDILKWSISVTISISDEKDILPKDATT